MTSWDRKAERVERFQKKKKSKSNDSDSNSDTEVEFDDSLLLNNESSITNLSKNVSKDQNPIDTSHKITQEENALEPAQGPESSDLVVRTMVEMITTGMKIKTKEET